MSSLAKRIPQFLFGSLFTAVAGFFLCISFQEAVQQTRLVTQGVETSATIVHAKVEERRSGKRGQKLSFQAVVTFRYVVDGRSLEASSVMPPEAYFDEQNEAASVLAGFPISHVVPAYYDPLTPAVATLERHVSFTPYWGLTFPFLHLGVGVMILFWACTPPTWRRRRLLLAGVLLMVIAICVITAFAHFLAIGGALDGMVTIGIAIIAALVIGAGWWWSRAWARWSGSRT